VIYQEDAYDLAVQFADRGCVPTCIPVIDEDAWEQVAVVSLDPNPIARIALTHEDRRVRSRALVAVAIKAHELLPDRGLTFDARYSP
jgi:hypothetical protein